jgi:thiol-disulfide isomerase/thioredoxin
MTSPRTSNLNIWIKIALLLCFIAAVAALFAAYDSQASGISPAASNTAAIHSAATASVPTGIGSVLREQSVSPMSMINSGSLANVILRNSKGGARLTIVNIWATWCPPCKEEIPEFVAFFKEMQAARKAVKLEFINVDSPKDRPAAERFLKSVNIHFLTHYLNEEPQTFIAKLDPKWAGTLPMTFVFGKSGKPLAAWSGQTTKAELSARVFPLLAESARTRKPTSQP